MEKEEKPVEESKPLVKSVPARPLLKTSLTCQGCNNEVPRAQITFINGRPFCPDCKKKLVSEIKSLRATGPEILTGFLGACAAAIVAGILWGLIVILTNYEIGYVAIGVGAVAGYGVYFASGKKRGFALQLLASGASILGILIGKYITFYHFYKQVIGESLKEENLELTSEIMSKISLFSLDVASDFFANISAMVSRLDILWIILAVGAAYKIPAMLNLKYQRAR